MGGRSFNITSDAFGGTLGTILDPSRNRAEILGVMVDLNLTAMGHYAFDILPKALSKGKGKGEEKVPKEKRPPYSSYTGSLVT